MAELTQNRSPVPLGSKYRARPNPSNEKTVLPPTSNAIAVDVPSTVLFKIMDVPPELTTVVLVLPPPPAPPLPTNRTPF